MNYLKMKMLMATLGSGEEEAVEEDNNLVSKQIK